MERHSKERWPEFFHSEKERKDRSETLRDERANFHELMQKTIASTDFFLKEYPALGNADLPLTDNDVMHMYALLQHIAPDVEKNRGLYEHLVVSSRLARKIADELRRKGDETLDPIKIEIRTLLDDLGRLMGQQRYVRNDLEGRALGKRMGLRDDFFDQRSAHDVVNPKAFDFEDLSTEDRIVIIADLVGKREKDGSVRTFDQALTVHRETRNDAEAHKQNIKKEPVFPSELRGLRDMSVDKDHFTDLYIKIDKWLVSQGIDIDELSKEI